MSEFDEDLARAVEHGVARGGLPGAADAVRRGGRRSRRARGGAAVLTVAALGGALGVGSAFGAGRGTDAAASAASTGGHSASAPATSHGDGLLAPDLWPGYDLVHWTPRPLSFGKTTRVSSMVLHCTPSDPSLPRSFPITGSTLFDNTYDTAHRLDADETVFSFADADAASAYLADARNAGTAQASCGTGPFSQVPAPGASTGYGVSWLLTQRQSGVDGMPLVTHNYLVRAGNRVALLRVTQFGDDFRSTAGDATLLAELRQALEK